MNHTYKIDGVKHVYCKDCIPESAWLLENIKAGRLTERALTSEPCEACGESGHGEYVREDK